ncbi:MAG: hypothetical protein CFH05_00387 [Alphaproteobacteria bacterium MarineAlpha3_Bin4]|nr:MAG: hypothetical protein CFH05_00387 [Alphaproteobacteria bacterium MarineAlpha3_Bin4]
MRPIGPWRIVLMANGLRKAQAYRHQGDMNSSSSVLPDVFANSISY